MNTNICLCGFAKCKNHTGYAWMFSPLLNKPTVDVFMVESCLNSCVLTPECWSLYECLPLATNNYELIREATMLEF